MKPVLKIESLKKYYGKSKTRTRALNGMTFQVMPGDSWALWAAAAPANPPC